MPDFKYEIKYGVFSIKDLQCLTSVEKEGLEYLLAKLRNYRVHARNKPLIDAAVVDRNALGTQAYSDTLKIIQQALKIKLQETCYHDWAKFFERDGRVEYVCKTCGAYDVSD